MSVDPNSQDKSPAISNGTLVPTERIMQPVGYSDDLSMDLFGSSSGTTGRPPMRQITLEQVLRHKWLALVVFLVVAIPGMAATWYFHVPMYKAQGGLLVKSSKPKIAYNVEDDRGNSRQRRNDQAATLTDTRVLKRVLEDPEVMNTLWYKDPPKTLLGNTLSEDERLIDALDISTPRDSSLIYVSMTCRKQGEAALIVNKLIHHCMEFVASDYEEDDDVILELQEAKLEELELDVKALNQDIQSLLKTSGLYTDDPSVLIQQKSLRLGIKEAELEELEGSLLLAEEKLQSLGLADPSFPGESSDESTNDTILTTPLAADSEWRRLNEALQDAEFAVEVALKRYGESHTQMITLRETERNAQKKLADYEQQIAGMPSLAAGTGSVDSATGIISAEGLEIRINHLNAQIKIVQDQIASITEELGDKTTQVSRLRDRQAELAQKKAEANRYRELSLARVTEKEAPPWLKARPAFTPSQPTNAKKRYMMMAMALLGGLGLGVATAYLRASTNKAVFAASDVIGPVETPFLAIFRGFVLPKRCRQSMSLSKRNIYAWSGRPCSNESRKVETTWS